MENGGLLKVTGGQRRNKTSEPTNYYIPFYFLLNLQCMVK